MPNYFDLRLTIQKVGSDDYQITAHGPSGERAGPEQLDWSALSDAKFTTRLDENSARPYAVDQYILSDIGTTLFEALFRGQVLRLFTGLYDQQVQPHSDTFLRLRLDIDENALEIAALPWELLWWRDVFLATQVQTLVGRQLLNLDYGSSTSLRISGTPRVLIVIPGGSNLEGCREEERVTGVLSASGIPFKVLKDQVPLAAVNDELATGNYHILHFVGHGAFLEGSRERPPKGYLRFNSGDGAGETWVDDTRLQSMLGNYRDLKLVLLNACRGASLGGRPGAKAGFSGIAPAILRAGVPAVVAMQTDITDEAAARFADTFYRRLTAGKWAGQVDLAVTLARNKCFIENPNDPSFAAPVLYLRSSDARIFDVACLQLPEPKTTPCNVFISYKRNVEPDEGLALRLHQALIHAGHKGFIDQTMKIGVAWAAEIQRQIEACNVMVVLLSGASAHSEMVAKEVEFAGRTGKRLLPVRINQPGPLPYQLSFVLDSLQHAVWQTDADTDHLIRQLLEAIADADALPPTAPSPATITSKQTAADVPVPHPYADPRFVESLREPGGAERLLSNLYIERDADIRLLRELGKSYGTTTTIRASRQTGKSSLLIRGLAHTKAAGRRAILVDLQASAVCDLADFDTFARYFALTICRKLQMDPVEAERAWHSPLGAADKLTYLMEDYVLPQIDSGLLLAIDEADRLLKTSFHDSFFGLLRSWHNNRAHNEIWDRLSLALVISTEPHLLISDVTQSPFNIGLKIRLDDFTDAQVREINLRHRAPLADTEIPGALEFLGGHPYLTRRALYTLVVESLTWPLLLRSIAEDGGVFGDHLRRYLWLLRDQAQLRGALRQIIAQGRCPDEFSYYRLWQAGLIRGPNSQSCHCRCKLYEAYLKDKL